jgi:hypothetical protein
MRKNIIFLIGMWLTAAMLFTACSKSDMDNGAQGPSNYNAYKFAVEYCGTPVVLNLRDRDQVVNAGTLTIGNDALRLFVTYELTGDWMIKNLALYAGPAASVPGTLNPDGTGTFEPWLFPYYYYPWDFIPTHTFEISLSTLDQCFTVVAYCMAHNMVTGQNMAVWAKSNTKVPGFWFEYCKQSCNPNPPLGGCEKGYAYGETYATCFLNIPGVQSNNWGWSNGLIGAGNYTWPIYAGAGQCNIGNGTYVGDLIVNYNPPNITVTYFMLDGYVINATHLYVGSQILPMKNNKYTTAPGQYPYKHKYPDGMQSDTFTLTGFNGDIYVVGHTVVCDEN